MTAARYVLVAVLAAWAVVGEATYLVDVPFGDSWVFEGNGYWAVIVLCVLATAGRAVARRGVERLGWVCLAAGIAGWGLGDVYYAYLMPADVFAPSPSLADFGYMSFNLWVGLGLMVLLRSRPRRPTRTQFLDGAASALGVTTLMAGIALTMIASSDTPLDVSGVVTMVYPVLDALLCGVFVLSWGMSGWRLDRTWVMLGVAVGLFAIGDSVYAVITVVGPEGAANPLGMAWSAAFVIIAIAALIARPPTPPRARADDRRLIAAPLLTLAYVLAVLVVGSTYHIHIVAVVLAVMTTGVTLLRLALTLQDHARMAVASQQEAATDALTGLSNRRALTRDLDIATATGDAYTLALFDLDGFKGYNDAFGHPAGDALLVRLSGRLAEGVHGEGVAYRLGGDEFCVLFGGRASSERLAAMAGTLSERGEGYVVACSFGAVHIPDEAGDTEAALRSADQRMYLRKHRGRDSAGKQAGDVLIGAITARVPAVAEHLHRVADLAEAVAAEMGLDGATHDQVRSTALLHEAGMVAVPDALLEASGLDDGDESVRRRLVLVGERVVGAAPALAHIAPLVRALAEHHDGTGFPDGLRGDDIPLPARIVAACDAWDRHASAGRDEAERTREALRQVRERSGSVLDPRVVSALTAVVTRRLAAVPAAAPS